MSQRNLAWLLLVPALVLLTAVVSWTAPPPSEDFQHVRNIVDVLGEVDRSYVRPLTPPEKKELVFVSDPSPSAPRFRLSYKQEKLDSVSVKFEIAPPGKPEEFKTYLQGVVQRRRPGK